MTEDAPKKTILAVDDTPENLDVVKGILVPEYNVKVAINGKMALKVVESQKPDLILLDIMMPEMDGYEVCEALKANPDTVDIPVIFLTAKDQTDDETKGFDLGGADYILKPVSPPVLKSRVRTHLALRSNMESLQDAYEIINTHKQRMEGELSVARDIQLGMVPVDFDNYSDHDQITLHATLEPAREVGGDFYDFFFIDDDRLCVCIGDVSGKGVPAALFMAVAKTMIKARAMDDPSTASIMTHVNEELSTNNPNGLFVTLWVGILSIKTGDLLFTNAGHNSPHIKRADNSLESLKQRHGPVAGAMEGLVFGEDHITLSPNDLLVLFTDGVTEAMDKDSNLYTDQRLEKIIVGAKVQDPKTMVQAIFSDVMAYENGIDQTDDVTILALRYDGNPEGAQVKQLTLTMRNDLKDIETVMEAFEGFAGQHDMPMAVTMKFNVVFDELLNNIVSYGFVEGSDQQIEIKLELLGNRLAVIVVDDGIPFNPLSKETPDIEASIEDREIGGLGIHIVRNLVDEVTYQRRIDKNVLTMVKHLGSENA